MSDIKALSVMEMINDLSSNKIVQSLPIRILCKNCGCDDSYTGATSNGKEVVITINDRY